MININKKQMIKFIVHNNQNYKRNNDSIYN